MACTELHHLTWFIGHRKYSHINDGGQCVRSKCFSNMSHMHNLYMRSTFLHDNLKNHVNDLVMHRSSSVVENTLVVTYALSSFSVINVSTAVTSHCQSLHIYFCMLLKLWHFR